MKRLIVPLVALAAAGLLAGCSKSLDGSSIQGQIADGMATQAGGSWTVSCPSDIAIEQGSTFTCDATNADGTTSTITVTQKDADGNVSWTSDISALDLDKVRTSIATDLGTQVGGTWTVTCPDKVDIGAGKTFTCQAESDSGQTTPITVTQTDTDGNISWTTGDGSAATASPAAS